MAELRPSGGYRDSCSFQTTTIIYDATYWFCEKFLEPRSRTVDQMVQAARSGRQNISEGRRAAATSSQTELRLVNVARSSLEELLLDGSHSRLPAMRQAHGLAHSQERQERRQAVLGLFRVPRLQGSGEPVSDLPRHEGERLIEDCLLHSRINSPV